jgi:hypothetical protein
MNILIFSIIVTILFFFIFALIYSNDNDYFLNKSATKYLDKLIDKLKDHKNKTNNTKEQK